MNDERKNKKFTFGNERFGGVFTPGELKFNFPEDMSREEFEKIFNSRIEAFHKRSNDLRDEIYKDSKRKEKLKPLSIRVKPHTKEFYKNDSILSPRDVLEIYENFNNGSEAFINSLLKEEKELEKELANIHKKLHNAKLFKEKLSEIEPESDVLTDEDKILKLKQNYQNSEIKIIGNEIPTKKVQKSIINNIQTYNTTLISVYDNEVLIIGVFTKIKPIIYYFKNECLKENIEEILREIESFCVNHEIKYEKNDSSLFEKM